MSHILWLIYWCYSQLNWMEVRRHWHKLLLFELMNGQCFVNYIIHKTYIHSNCVFMCSIEWRFTTHTPISVFPTIFAFIIFIMFGMCVRIHSAFTLWFLSEWDEKIETHKRRGRFVRWTMSNDGWGWSTNIKHRTEIYRSTSVGLSPS